MNNLVKMLLSLALISLFGCTTKIIPYKHELTNSEKINIKNYEIGKKQSVYVGQAIIRVKQYKLDSFTAKYMQANNNFSISAGALKISGDSQTDYNVNGETLINGEKYFVLDTPIRYSAGIIYQYKILVDEQGYPHNRILNDNVIMVHKFTISPKDLKFNPSKNKKIDASDDFLNYELIYSGTDGESLKITYREYTPEDFARPAFYQDLIYKIGEDQIRFRNTVIKIHKVTNEQLSYTVISDDR